MRKLNEQATGTTFSSSSTPGTSPAKNEESETEKPNTIVIDPGARARAAAAGGEVEPTESQSPSLPVIPLKPGQSAWQTRHGAGLGIMEVTRQVGSSFPSSSLLPLARELLSLLAMDRFGDFVGETVIAPVRETAAQALGVLLKYLDVSSVEEVHHTLMEMVRQSWAKRRGAKESGERFAWEVRHAGLLGLKYEVAVRADLIGGVKKDEEDVKHDMDMEGMNLLADVVDAAILAQVLWDGDCHPIADQKQPARSRRRCTDCRCVCPSSGHSSTSISLNIRRAREARRCFVGLSCRG